MSTEQVVTDVSDAVIKNLPSQYQQPLTGIRNAGINTIKYMKQPQTINGLKYQQSHEPANKKGSKFRNFMRKVGTGFSNFWKTGSKAVKSAIGLIPGGNIINTGINGVESLVDAIKQRKKDD